MKAEEKLTPIGLGDAWVRALKEDQERFGQTRRNKLKTEKDFICGKCKNGALYFDDVVGSPTHANPNGKTRMRYKCEACDDTIWLELTPIIDLDYKYFGETN